MRAAEGASRKVLDRREKAVPSGCMGQSGAQRQGGHSLRGHVQELQCLPRTPTDPKDGLPVRQTTLAVGWKMLWKEGGETQERLLPWSRADQLLNLTRHHGETERMPLRCAMT